MQTKGTLQQQIAETEAKLKELKEQAQRMDSKYPNGCVKFWVINEDNSIYDSIWYDLLSQKSTFDYGNGFKTEEEAKEKQEWNELNRQIKEFILSQIHELKNDSKLHEIISELSDKITYNSQKYGVITAGNTLRKFSDERIKWWLEGF